MTVLAGLTGGLFGALVTYAVVRMVDTRRRHDRISDELGALRRLHERHDSARAIDAYAAQQWADRNPSMGPQQ